MTGLLGVPDGLPGQRGDHAPAARGEVLEPGGVQRAVRLAQRLPQLQEPPALLRFRAQQQVGRPGSQGRAARGTEPAVVLGAAVGPCGGGQLRTPGDEAGRWRGVQLVESRLRPAPAVAPGVRALVPHASQPPPRRPVPHAGERGITASGNLGVRRVCG